MKHFPLLLALLLAFSGCKFEKSNVLPIKTLDVFEAEEDNIQLGIDLVNYEYGPFIRENFPDFSEEVLENIHWKYRTLQVMGEDKKNVSFILTLKNEAIPHSEALEAFFKEIVDHQVEVQRNNKALFDRAIETAKRHAEMLDNSDIDAFWADASHTFKSSTKKEDLRGDFTLKRDFNTDTRQLNYKLFYNKLANVEEEGFYIISFTFEDDRSKSERFFYHLEGDSLKIVGYNLRY